MIKRYLKKSVKDGVDVNAIMCDMMFIIFEYTLDDKLKDEQG